MDGESFMERVKRTFLKQNVRRDALLIDIAAWVVANRIVVPLNLIPLLSFNFISVFETILFLYFCIGFPIAFGLKDLSA